MTSSRGPQTGYRHIDIDRQRERGGEDVGLDNQRTHITEREGRGGKEGVRLPTDAKITSSYTSASNITDKYMIHLCARLQGEDLVSDVGIRQGLTALWVFGSEHEGEHVLAVHPLPTSQLLLPSQRDRERESTRIKHTDKAHIRKHT